MTTAAAVEAPHVEAALTWARAVVAGDEVACRYVRLACERQLRDLERAETDPDWPYVFDPVKAERVCLFVEMMPHVKGTWANRSETLRLEPWQAFILTTVFGWVRKDTGTRRFRYVYIEVPRKNAKSTLSSAVALYMLAMDGEFGAGVYSGATTRDQARITFDDARVMVERTPEFAGRYGVTAGRHAITVLAKNSTFKPITREQSANEGLSVHCGLLDEVHAHKTRDVYSTLRQGMGARTQPLLWMITTAGSDQSGLCYEQRSGVIQILERRSGDQELEAFFGIVFTIDEGDDWTSPVAWRKANPNLGVSVYEADMAAACAQAQLLAGERNEFLTKRLNVWVTAGSPFFDVEAWRACAEPDLDEASYVGREGYGGLDLASRTDLTAYLRVFPEEDGRLAVFGRYWLPEETIRKSGNASYAGWAADGHINVTPGSVTDWGYLEQEIVADSARFTMRELAYDPHQAEYLRIRLEAQGVPMVEQRQGVLLSDAMKELEALIVAKRIRHNGDPVLAWAVSNVVGRFDSFDNVKPEKETPAQKIDPAVALMIALKRVLAHQDDGGFIEMSVW